MEHIDQNILDNYEVIDRLEEKRRDCFWKCIDKHSKKNVAIKLYEAGDLSYQIETIMLMDDLRDHENILKIQKIIKGQKGTNVYVVYDYVDMNALQLLKQEPAYTDHNVRYITYQLLKAVNFVHSADLILLNLNPYSVLIDKSFKVKLTRFGNCVFDKDPKKEVPINYFTPRKEAYYAPEVLLKSTSYTFAADMWAVGCILGELLLRRPLFMGLNFSSQLRSMVEIIGPSTDEDLDALGVRDARGMFRSNYIPHVSLLQKLPYAPKEALDLLQKLLHINPSKRISAAEALKHPYLAEFHGTENESVCTTKIKLFDTTGIKDEELAEKLIQEFNARRK